MNENFEEEMIEKYAYLKERGLKKKWLGICIFKKVKVNILNLLAVPTKLLTSLFWPTKNGDSQSQ